MKQRGKSLFLMLTLAVILILFSNFCFAGILEVTEEHPFLINGTWISASDLKVGDELTTIDENKIRITEITDVETKEPFSVYNLEAGVYHNFVVGLDKVVVHNSNNIQKEYDMGIFNYRIKINPKQEYLLKTKPIIPDVASHFSGVSPDDFVYVYHYTTKENAIKILNSRYILPTDYKSGNIPLIMRGYNEGTYITTRAPDNLNAYFAKMHGLGVPNAKDLYAVRLRVPKSLVSPSAKMSHFRIDRTTDDYFITGSKSLGFNFDGLPVSAEMIKVGDIPVKPMTDLFMKLDRYKGLYIMLATEGSMVTYAIISNKNSTTTP
jgi:hypothetical protein